MRSLRTALILAVVLPLAAAAAGAGVLVLRTLEQEAVSRMEEDVQLVARAIRLPLSRALERDQVQGAIDALESAFRIGRVYGALLYDSDGNLVSAAGAADVREDPERISAMAEEEDRQGEYGRAGSEEVYSYFVPLTSFGERPIGLLQVTRRRSDIRDYVDRLRMQFAGAMVLGLGAMVGLVLVGHRRVVGRHLDRILDGMSRVEQGEREHRTEVRGPREISDLTRALNRMLDSIARAEDDVRDHREEQLRLERELQRTEKLATVGRLGAGVAHELGTPLSALDGRAQRLLRRDLPDEVSAGLHEIRDQAFRMQEIVRQLLDFGRGVHRPRRPVSTEELVGSVVASHEEAAEEAGLELRVSEPADPPTPPTLTTLTVDPGGMEQALGNLVRNALQVARNRVEVAWYRDDDRKEVVVRVSDDGPGVDPEIEDRIFDPFFTTKNTGEGTGLGLAVVHGILEDHGGRVEVGRSPLGGAEFRIIVPIPDEERHV